MRNQQALAGDHGYVLHSWKQHFQTADSLGEGFPGRTRGLAAAQVGSRHRREALTDAEAKSLGSEVIACVEPKPPEF